MANAETQTAENTIVAAIQELIQRRGDTAIVVRPESHLLTDLEVDSLDLAELQTMLADEFGRDPFSDGIFPETVAELIAFYNT